MSSYLGIDIGGGSMKGVLIRQDGTLIRSESVPTEKNWSNQPFLDALIGLIQKLAKGEGLKCVGVGTPGPIDLDRGLILKSANIPNLKDTPLREEVSKNTGLDVRFNNDANCAALGEYHFGAGVGTANMVVLTLGTGLGCGWVWNGKIYNGYKGNGMEAGHVTVVKDGALCPCGGRGCAEAYFSATGFISRYKDKTGIQLESAEEFFRLAGNKEQTATEILNNGTSALAELIRNLAHTINPEKVILVGGLMKSYSLFKKNLEDKVRAIIFPVFQDYLKIVEGKSVAGGYGAASLCIHDS